MIGWHRVWLLTLLGACGRGAPLPDPDGDPNPLPIDDCLERCTEKTELCGSPPGFARAKCASAVCAYAPSEDRVRCMERIECGRLAAAFADSAIFCDIGPAWLVCSPQPSEGRCPPGCTEPIDRGEGRLYCTAPCGPEGRCPIDHACQDAVCQPMTDDPRPAPEND